MGSPSRDGASSPHVSDSSGAVFLPILPGVQTFESRGTPPQGPTVPPEILTDRRSGKIPHSFDPTQANGANPVSALCFALARPPRAPVGLCRIHLPRLYLSTRITIDLVPLRGIGHGGSHRSHFSDSSDTKGTRARRQNSRLLAQIDRGKKRPTPPIATIILRSEGETNVRGGGSETSCLGILPRRGERDCKDAKKSIETTRICWTPTPEPPPKDWCAGIEIV
eukprot:scaffold690_cov327-Pavlova_lutheri.AAC.15